MRPSCAGTAKSSKAIGLVLFLPWAAFAGLRVYALSKRWILAALVFLLSVVPLCVNAVVFKYGVTGINVTMMGCVGTDSMPRFLAQSHDRVEDVPHCGGLISLIDVLLRDGTIYFVVLLVLNVLHLVFTLLSTNVVAFQNTSFIPIFTQPLTTNLVSRFLLDLQAADRAVRDQVSSLSSTTLSRNSTVMFRERPVDSVACSIPLDDYHSEHEHHPGSNLSDSWEIR
ncbi:hypothetical protein GSI_10818 [Ganoderma sinense ZZ0214-1]|uniref:Uncharacterized protein n=1 Tax=Ganoderma sinense ZZ0214-1 TaxID=1077348 RepID=A0A2G8S1M4_9APHY|nr:hypothetical protein GSI_10818 [Ganoderma sinense ZZ0214-1]